MANTPYLPPLVCPAAECRSDFSYGKAAIRLNTEQTAGLPCREDPARINTTFSYKNFLIQQLPEIVFIYGKKKKKKKQEMGKSPKIFQV